MKIFLLTTKSETVLTFRKGLIEELKQRGFRVSVIAHDREREEDIKALNAMTISFFKDGTIEGRIATGPFTGKWAANGEDRTISITQLKYNGSPSGKSKEFMEALKNAAYYKGDSNYLKLAPQEKKSYVQLGHYSK